MSEQSTGTADLRGEEVSYQADGVTLKGYLAWNAAAPGPRPGVLVVHEWWGATDYVRRRARMLAEQGYVALAVDMYGDGRIAHTPDEARALMLGVLGNPGGMQARFIAARDFLAAQPQTDAPRIAAIGYCFGGAVALHMARAGLDLKGVASFHGNLGTQQPAQPGQVKAKVLVLHGGADQLVPEPLVHAFHQEMQAAGVDYRFIAYPGVKHGFTNPAATGNGQKYGLPLAYDEAADQASWQELRGFLQQVLGG